MHSGEEKDYFNKIHIHRCDLTALGKKDKNRCMQMTAKINNTTTDE